MAGAALPHGRWCWTEVLVPEMDLVRHPPTERCGKGSKGGQKESAALCQCIELCPDHFVPVCGSDGCSYDNHCLFHHLACLSGSTSKCDADKDNYVNSDELLNCTSGSFFLAPPEQENELTRALCIDAIVDVADNNHDLPLDFEEFTRILNPDFRPAHKLCLLDGMKYDDGEDVC
nr:follistatin-related protein 1-like [Procambarus clarkii]